MTDTSAAVGSSPRWRLEKQERRADFAESLLNEEWIIRVAFTRDRDLRAHRIALTYHYFARELDRLINGEEGVWSRLERDESPRVINANWFNFATWATVTVNRDLALGRLPATPGWAAHGAVRRTLTPALLQLRASDNQRVSRALSWGQRLVFLSTTLTLLGHNTRRKDEVHNDIEAYSTWDGHTVLGRKRHLDVIWSAFDDYANAVTAAEKLRARLTGKGERSEVRRLRSVVARNTLLANLKITAVEQDVVDQPVRAVIEAVPGRLAESAVGRMARWGERYLDFPRELTGLELPEELGPFSRGATEAWARFMTAQVLVMLLPSETLRLGRDLPPRYSDGPFFPPDLSDLTCLPGSDVVGMSEGDSEKWQEAERGAKRLPAVVSVFDRSRGDGMGSAARDWRVYDDRMNWAVNMIRSRQQDLTLYWPPYTEEDQERIYVGKLPHQLGDPTQHEVDAPFADRPATRLRREGYGR